VFTYIIVLLSKLDEGIEFFFINWIESLSESEYKRVIKNGDFD